MGRTLDEGLVNLWSVPPLAICQGGMDWIQLGGDISRLPGVDAVQRYNYSRL
jgi:hypothetical protein